MTSTNQQLLFPPTEFKVQSPYLYLQTVGSTGADGSTYGAHVRYSLLRNLGTHLPKGDYASTRVNFNKPDDYLTLFRSQYLKRFPTIVDLSLPPNVVNDGSGFWIYSATNTNTVVYLHFRNQAKYAVTRATINPSLAPLEFMQQYCPGLIEAEVKDKLFFAAEFDVVRSATTVMRVEALSVETNVPLSPLFVSCRKIFTHANWCDAAGPQRDPKGKVIGDPVSPEPLDAPACCDGRNLLRNGNFENDVDAFEFETDYILQGGAQAGAINVADDASRINGRWVGLPHRGQQFLTVDGSTTPGSAVVRVKLEVEPETDYCLTGWLATLWPSDVSIPLEFRLTSPGRLQVFSQSTPASVSEWEEFAFSWSSGNSQTVTLEIISLSTRSVGNDFGLDDLWFCRAKSAACSARIGSENIRSVRFDVNGGYPRRLEFETYHDYLAEAAWDTLDRLALTLGPTQGLDGMVLEISINGGPYTDILVAGGNFLTGGYTHSISSAFNSPIAGSFAWSGLSGGTPAAPAYIETAVRLPPTANGQTIKLKWRLATDNSAVAAGVSGVRIDNIAIAPAVFSENFDGVIAPALPGGWTTATTGAGVAWVTSAISPDSAPNDAFAPAVDAVGNTDLITPTIAVPADGGILTFHHLFNLEFNATKDNRAFSRLEPAPNTVNGHWQKFNDNALLNVSNYQDRWNRAGGLGEGVQRYIALSDSDPMALVKLSGDVQPQDGAIEISLLDALLMVSLDFHVARMLGLGHLDQTIANDTDQFIYLGVYDTEGALDDTNVARSVRHYFMGQITRPLDHRLPDAPRLKPATYGLTVDNGEPQPTYLTDQQGYTPDGLSRYVNLFVEPDADVELLEPFFVPPIEFCSSDKTASVFYGIEHRRQLESGWRKPEIAHDAAYQDLDTPPQFETLPLPNNGDQTKPIFRHDEREAGVHEYGAYGINWFSRVSPVGNVVATDATVFQPAQRLLPPANLAVQLIQPELPLMLTTHAEQVALANLTGTDQTLVRVTFDYFHVHDSNYEFADTVELFFRPEMPRNVVGAIWSVVDDPADSRRAIIRTVAYTVNSRGTTISPTLDAALFDNFLGGVISCQEQNYIITNVASSTMVGEGPIFTVQKNVRGNAADPGAVGTFITVQQYVAPNLAVNGPVMFMAVENMANPVSWGIPNPLAKIIRLGDSSWTTHEETSVQDGEPVTVKLRGVVSPAVITKNTATTVAGVYLIQFQTYQLSRHPQHADADPVDWYKGVVRVAKRHDPNGPKKVLEVILVEHLGDAQPLVLHVVDNAFDPHDEVILGVPVDVNYYPGYKVYLHADPAHDFTAATILPAAGEGNRKTWLGARSCDTTRSYHSAVGIPAAIVALEFVNPQMPDRPAGGEFATRPDFYYKSSYTFRLNFAPGHKPFAVVMYRANDEDILRSLYSDVTYDDVRQQLGEADPYRTDRWQSLVEFDYSITTGTFKRFPPDGYAFPTPDKAGLLDGVAAEDIIATLKDAIWGAFTPLTELPLLYDFIKDPAYVPVPKRQNIRNAQGALLAPSDPAFDMAPMAKRTGNGSEIQFTDFTLDGTGNNIFFYCGREIGNRGRLSDPGPIAGPIQLVNTRPPDTPGVKKMYVEEFDRLEHTGPAVKFEINAYADVQKVGAVLIYRANVAADALSVRTMELVKTVDLVRTNQLNQPRIRLADDFENGFVPYGDPLFYRIVALRQVNNPDGGIDWAPSQPSKLLLTTVVDVINPESPEITFTSNGLSGSPATLTGVKLSWPTTVYNGTYFLEKMNAAGNWVMVYRIKTNTTPIVVDLAATDLGTNVLPKEDADEGRPIYNRFRVRVENSSGLFSASDKVLII